MTSILEIDFAQPEGFRPLSLDLRTPDAAGEKYWTQYMPEFQFRD
jgi:hypothetical protein